MEHSDLIFILRFNNRRKYIMGKTNKLKMGKITVSEPTEEKRREILDIIEIMMMDYINRKSEEEEGGKVD